VNSGQVSDGKKDSRMAERNNKQKNTSSAYSPEIVAVSVAGYKSIGEETTVAIQPLTILAGANSSGKSSIMQPLLLLKQTMEAPYDPGALLLNGPNVRFTSADQMLFRSTKRPQVNDLSVGFHLGEHSPITLKFHREPGKRLDLGSITITEANRAVAISPLVQSTELIRLSLKEMGFPIDVNTNTTNLFEERFRCELVRERCFFRAQFYVELNGKWSPGVSHLIGAEVGPILQGLMHLPGLRGNPERSYPVTSVGRDFPGTFEKYVASVVAQWAAEGSENLDQLGRDLRGLGLTWKATATAVDDTQVELKIGRMPQPARGGAHDLVNIADVGFGVSQTLPVVVALLAARAGQLVYVEQPEIHLHPRAQVAMARLLANAANRGVRVVAETHSSLLLLGVQSLVAEGALSPDKVKLHWFQRNSEGVTEVRSADLDELGRFGDWPEDFADVTLETEHRYLSAAEAKQSAT
jgi:hypothetical protein